MTSRSLFWFRDDLRLADNPGLLAALARGPALCVHIDDDDDEERRPLGGASRWWLQRSLTALGAAIAAKGGRLLLLRGDPAELVPRLAAAAGCDHVCWNRRYEPRQTALDRTIKAALREAGIAAESHKAGLLHEPWELATKAGGPFKVFGAFWRAARQGSDSYPPAAEPRRIAALPVPPEFEVLAAPFAEPASEPDWSGGLSERWRPGEHGARDTLIRFLDERLADYAARRDEPGAPVGSELSPHLRFGEIGPRQIVNAVAHAVAARSALAQPAETFLRELGWREFAHHVLFHEPDLARQNIDRRFDAFPWRQDEQALRAWRRGRTGIPLVDAGMRELWTTGTMHNRVRMIAASFLTKHLLTDWREGERWFWDTLCDADAANNPFNWQWVAGCGTDAAPYFRIFNPVTQGERFDPAGAYVRRWVPEIAGLRDRKLHRPWEATPEELAAAGIRLGETYPQPIVDLAAGRERALAAFASLRLG